MARRITDALIWQAIRDEAASIGWDDETRLIHVATTKIGRRFRLSDDERDAVSGRARKMWVDRMINWIGVA